MDRQIIKSTVVDTAKAVLKRADEITNMVGIEEESLLSVAAGTVYDRELQALSMEGVEVDHASDLHTLLNISNEAREMLVNRYAEVLSNELGFYRKTYEEMNLTYEKLSDEKEMISWTPYIYEYGPFLAGDKALEVVRDYPYRVEGSSTALSNVQLLDEHISRKLMHTYGFDDETAAIAIESNHNIKALTFNDIDIIKLYKTTEYFMAVLNTELPGDAPFSPKKVNAWAMTRLKFLMEQYKIVLHQHGIAQAEGKIVVVKKGGPVPTDVVVYKYAVERYARDISMLVIPDKKLTVGLVDEYKEGLLKEAALIKDKVNANTIANRTTDTIQRVRKLGLELGVSEEDIKAIQSDILDGDISDYQIVKRLYTAKPNMRNLKQFLSVKDVYWSLSKDGTKMVEALYIVIRHLLLGVKG